MEKTIPKHRTVYGVCIAVTLALLSVPGVMFGQSGQPSAVQSYDKLPDWSGVWAMQGGTVFDRATQTGTGGSVNVGVREHPPYNAEWEAIYKSHLDLRDKNLFPDTQTNCGVPAGFPRHFNLP